MTTINYKLGIITGFIFGLFISLFAVFGLVSYSAEIIGKALAIPGITFSTIFGNSILVSFFFNGIFYALIGSLIQYLLKKENKNEKIVMFIFLVVITLLIFLVFVELLVRGGLIA